MKSSQSPRRLGRFVRALALVGTVAALTLTAATPALARTHGRYRSRRQYGDYPVALVAITPQPGDVAGAGGAFNIDLALFARNSSGNDLLSAANGYIPGLNLPPAVSSGPGKPDPNVPGLVVTLSTTPAAAGGPNANLAGLFQENAVAQSFGQQQVFTDWEVGKPGIFGNNIPTTLTAYVVRGTAPGTVTGNEQPISNVVRETFTIGG
ncbi:MAG TPA: hypothetical protein VMA77_10775 [Solirubrobacteraceae bacterium]|nr:hypothetical protein [Solirubrobacteraceae bacterium]